MAIFREAYELTCREEGGYANIQGDNGGETMWGIARNFWGGDKRLRQFWRELDWYKQGLEHLKGQGEYTGRLNALCAGNTSMISEAMGFYREEFWMKMKGEWIKDQKVANQIYDFFVNAGKNAIKVLQRELGVDADGIFGEKTLEAVNNAENLNARLLEKRIAYYKSLNKPKFEKGWLLRANRFA